MEMVTSVLRLRELVVLVFLHTAEDPVPEEWAGGMRLWKELRAELKGDFSKSRSLVVTDGGAPNARQRAEMNEVFAGQPHKIVVITNSLSNPLKRGVATAIGWVNPSFKAVGPDQWWSALQHTDLLQESERLLQELQRMQATLAPVKTLAHLLAESGSAAFSGRRAAR
jgi:hypothetical protein